MVRKAVRAFDVDAMGRRSHLGHHRAETRLGDAVGTDDGPVASLDERPLITGKGPLRGALQVNQDVFAHD